MLDFKQMITQSLLALLPDFSFEVSYSDNSAKEIASKILQNIHVLGSNTSFMPFSHVEFYFEGDKILDSSTMKVNVSKVVSRIDEELPELSFSTQAFYDLVLEVFDNNNKKVFTATSEVKISLSQSGYKVNVTHISDKWYLRDVVDRFSDLDMDDMDKLIVPVDNKFRFMGLDLDMDTKPKKKKSKETPDLRFSTLDLNSKRRNKRKMKPEALLFQQDTQQDQTQVQTAAQKLGKQTSTSTQQVSKSIQSQVDKMSYQKAYDVVEDAMKAWDNADAYDQYRDTVSLASKWYGDNLVLVNGFDIIDKIYYAADLARKIAKLEDDIANSKSRTAITKLKKELDVLKKDLNNITPQIQSALHGARGYDAVEAKAKELEDKKDDYIDDYHSNLAEWKALKGKMEKAGKLIETMEAIKAKYAGQYDLPPLMSRYKTLMDTPIPTIMDVDSFDVPDLNAVYTAWRQSMMDYRKELESFTESMRANYDVLAKLLALKAKSKSLF